jgi:hypothetical protein
MNCAAWNKIRFTLANMHGFSIYGKSDYAFHSVNGFIVPFVGMRQRHLGSNRNRKFKHGYGTVRVGSFQQEPNSYLPNSDNLAFHGDRMFSLSLSRLRSLPNSSIFPATAGAQRTPAVRASAGPCLRPDARHCFTLNTRKYWCGRKVCSASARNPFFPLMMGRGLTWYSDSSGRR